MPPKPVVLLRTARRLVIDSVDPMIRSLCEIHFCYVEKKFVHGLEAKRRRKQRRPVFDEIEWQCFAIDHRGRICIPFGFYERLCVILRANNFEPELRWASPSLAAEHAERRSTIFKPRWGRIKEFMRETGFQFRHGQQEFLVLMTKEEGGRIDCPTGWGKGTLVMLACMLFPQAKIDVVVDSRAILKTRLYPELSMALPSVGAVGGGMKIKGCRVMCYTADSLHHARRDADIVLVDEGHQAGADKYAANLGRYHNANFWMFSASWNKRADNKDMRTEGMAGPIRLTIDYEEARREGSVVPIQVRWRTVDMDENPCADMNDTRKKRWGLWRNAYRNDLIAEDAMSYDDDTQVLITVETLEHALYLQKKLPHFKVIYASSIKRQDIEYWENKFPETFRVMTHERLRKLTARFEAGELKRAIATTVWNVGVNFKHLEVLIRADGGSSKINDTQIPGRTARTNENLKKKDGTVIKQVGILHDYNDVFDPGFARRSSGRSDSYASHFWEQIDLDEDRTSKLRKRMRFGG